MTIRAAAKRIVRGMVAALLGATVLHAMAAAGPDGPTPSAAAAAHARAEAELTAHGL